MSCIFFGGGGSMADTNRCSGDPGAGDEEGGVDVDDGEEVETSGGVMVEGDATKREDNEDEDDDEEEEDDDDCDDCPWIASASDWKYGNSLRDGPVEEEEEDDDDDDVETSDLV
jgi:hypothetical protein